MNKVSNEIVYSKLHDRAGFFYLQERRDVENLKEEYPFQEEAIFADIGRLLLEAFSIVHILR